MEDNVKIRCIDLPCTIKGITVQDGNGFYNVYINAKLSEEAQKQALEHELTHIKRNDFYSFEPIQAIENFKFFGK